MAFFIAGTTFSSTLFGRIGSPNHRVCHQAHNSEIEDHSCRLFLSSMGKRWPDKFHQAVAVVILHHGSGVASAGPI